MENEGQVKGLMLKLSLIDLLRMVMIGQPRFCLGRLTLVIRQ